MYLCTAAKRLRNWMGWPEVRCMMRKRTKKEQPPQDDDLWAWVVIGVIFGGVTLAVYGSLVWQATHKLL
jgi:hypothetical protein